MSEIFLNERSMLLIYVLVAHSWQLENPGPYDITIYLDNAE